MNYKIIKKKIYHKPQWKTIRNCLSEKFPPSEPSKNKFQDDVLKLSTETKQVFCCF